MSKCEIVCASPCLILCALCAHKAHAYKKTLRTKCKSPWVHLSLSLSFYPFFVYFLVSQNQANERGASNLHPLFSLFLAIFCVYTLSLPLSLYFIFLYEYVHVCECVCVFWLASLHFILFRSLSLTYHFHFLLCLFVYFIIRRQSTSSLWTLS